nr:DUF2922 domain-containing protein [Mammaliicoccus sciuri]
MKRVLELTFKTSLEKTFTLQIKNPKQTYQAIS